MNSPFSQEQYNKLLNGLNINVFKFSELHKEFLLLGSEFYSKQKVNAEKLLIGEKRLSHYFTLDETVVKEIHEDTICYDLSHSLTNYLENNNKIKNLDSSKKVGKTGSFVISRLRSYLKEMAIIENKTTPQCFSTEYLILKPSHEGELSSYSLLPFCLTKPVQTILAYSQYGSEHPRFYEFSLLDIVIPTSLIRLNSLITAIVMKSYKLRKLSNILYTKAEETFLKSIDFNIAEIERNSNNVKSFQNSVIKTNRLDAEYYQYKYDYVTETIVKGDYKKLKEIASIKKSIEPGSLTYQEEGVPFIRVSDITNFGVSKTSIFLNEKMIPNLKEYFVKKDTILFSKDATLGIAYLVEKDMEAVTSSGILHLNTLGEHVMKNYLTLVLNSPLVQLQAERDAGGSIIKHWSVTQISKVLVPLVNPSIQKEIEEIVKKSFEVRSLSTLLLNIAVQSIEIAIKNNNYKSSIEFIKSQINHSDVKL